MDRLGAARQPSANDAGRAAAAKTEAATQPTVEPRAVAGARPVVAGVKADKEPLAEPIAGPDKAAGEPPLRDTAMATYGCKVETPHPNSLWRRDLVYPARGLRIEVRPMTPDDDQRELDFFAAQTVRERIMRFMGVRNRLLPHEVRQLTHVDFGRDFALVAADRKTDALVGVARYCRDPKDPAVASAAIAVLQSYQRLGLARYLVAALFDAAMEHGVRTLVAEILRENVASRRLFDKVAGQVGATKRLADVDYDVYTYHFGLPSSMAKGLPGAEADGPPEPAGPEAPAAGPPTFVVDDSRHPRSLWRHELVFPSGARLEVRPADPDDRLRVQHFAEAIAGSDAMAVHDLSHIDFAHGFTLVAIDTASDEFVGVAHFHRGPDWSRLNVLTAPSHRGLGIADFLAAELLRAAETEVVPHRRAAL